MTYTNKNMGFHQCSPSASSCQPALPASSAPAKCCHIPLPPRALCRWCSVARNAFTWREPSWLLAFELACLNSINHWFQNRHIQLPSLQISAFLVRAVPNCSAIIQKAKPLRSLSKEPFLSFISIDMHSLSRIPCTHFHYFFKYLSWTYFNEHYIHMVSMHANSNC